MFYFNEIKTIVWYRIISILRQTKIYPLLYKSYWHSLFFKNNKPNYNNYFSATPNKGAGIGHQISNWIAGYWFSKQFNLNFAHTPFPSKDWEFFLGFGSDEISVDDLVKNKRFKKILIPLFDEYNKKEIDMIKKIINSYGDSNVVFMCEQDQFYRDQFGVMDVIKEKFYQAKSREGEHLIYDPKKFNIALHIRRGDILKNLKSNKNHSMRLQSNEYFFNVLENTLRMIKTKKKIKIYLFSQGEKSKFDQFRYFSNIEFCLDMTAKETFLHLVFSDILIMSKSSFSYKPGLLNNGLKVCPNNFWHSYPKTKDWMIVNENFSII